MVQKIAEIIVKPISGYIVDYFNKIKEVISAFSVLCAICLCLLLFAPAIPNESVFEKIDLCNQREKNFNYTNLIINPLNDHEIYPTSYEISTNFAQKKNCSHLYQFIINATQSNSTFYANQIYPKDKKIKNVSRQCLTNESCSPDYYKNRTIIESCVFCCESQCYLISEITLKDKNDGNADRNSVGNDFEFYQFWIFALLYIVILTCNGTILNLTDTACCETVEKHGKDFGHQRLWGAIGWGIFAPIGGFVDDLTEDYLAAMALCGILTLLMLINLSKMNLVKPHFCKNILKDVGIVIKSENFLYFFVATVVNGIGNGMVWYYLIWHVVSIGGDRLICGLVHAIQCFAGEIPFMFFSGWIVKRIGYFNVTTVTLLAACARFFWYSQVQNPWWILLSEWTHGISYGLFYTSLVSFGKLNAKPGTEATIQAIMSLGHEDLGGGLGNIVTGVGFNYFGGHQTFFC